MSTPTLRQKNTTAGGTNATDGDFTTLTSLLPAPAPALRNDSSSSNSSRWGPYSSAKEFDANMATVLVVLVCATILAFSLHAVLRFILRRLQRRAPAAGLEQQHQQQQEQPSVKASSLAPQLPGSTVLFVAGKTAVVGAPECAICLAELAEGEQVRVMPACSHAFHAQCVEVWLATRHSCPTCRTDSRAPAGSVAAPAVEEP